MTRRIFLPWDEPALPAVAAVLAERYADGGALSLDRALVVVQGARAGRRLTELLLEEAAARSLVLTPPESVTIGRLPERLYRPERPLAPPVVARTAWAKALRGLGEGRRSLVFPESPEPDDRPGWDRLGGLVGRLHRDVAAERLDFSDVAAACRRGGGFDDSARWEALAVAERAYHRQLRALGHVDREAARREALDRGEVRTESDLYLVGIAELPGLTRAMLGALDRPILAFVHAPEDLAEAFDELGCVVPAAWERREIHIPEEAIRVAGRPPAQVDEVVRCLAGPGSSLAPDEVTVGAPDDALVPFLEQRFRAHDIPSRWAAGTPLPRTDPFRLLGAVADYLGERRYPAFAALLRHPDVEGRIGVAAALEHADDHYRKHLPTRVAPPKGRSREAFDLIVDAVERDLGLGRLRGRRPISEWMPEILAFLTRAYGDRELDRSRPGDRVLVGACEALREGAASWSALPADLDDPCGAAAAILLLLEAVRHDAVPARPDTSAVEILGWLELHLDDAPVLILTGLDEAHVPGSIHADPFLPDALRARLGLADDRSRYARDAYLLSAMLSCRREAWLVVGRSSAEGDPLRPSRLLLASPRERLAGRVELLFGERKAPTARLERPDLEPARESAFSSPPQPTLAIPRPPVRLRVTDFRLLLRAPYQFALGRLLDLQELDDRARELDALAFGELAHTVLRRFGESEASRSEDLRSIRDRLDDFLDGLAAERFGRDVLPAVRLQVEQLRLRLHAFAAWQARRAREGWEVVGVEIDAPGEGAPFQVDVDEDPILLTGRIDRVDRNVRTGAWAILDYKTSASPATPEATHRTGHGADRRWTDLQLPLYRHLLPVMAEAGRLPTEILDAVDALSMGYVNLSREGAAEAMAAWGAKDLASADEAAREAVRMLRSGAISFEGESVRRHSPLATLLGRGRLRYGTEIEEPEEEA